MDRQKMRSSNIQTSISSVVGSATSFYMNWLKSKFPQGFFKDTYVSGMLTSIETERKDIYKKEKPLLITRPEYAAENGFMETLPYWHNTLQYVFNDSDRYYTPVFKDLEKKISIHAIPDRIKINFPTRILIPTKVYGMNLLHYMKNIIEPGGHGFINNVFFENEIPASFINMIFDIIFNEEVRNNNKDIEDQITQLEKVLYNREARIIENLKEINRLSNIHDEEGKVTNDESLQIMELNMEVTQLNRDAKKLRTQIDELRTKLKPLRYLSDPDPEKRKQNREDLEAYLNKFSNNNITCRKNLSTGNYEYAFKNRTNILVHMDSLPTLDGVRKGRTEDYAVVAFEVSLDFNTNSNFIFETDFGYKPEIIEEELRAGRYQFNICFDELVPQYLLDGGRHFIFRQKRKFVCDFNVDVDTLSFEDLFDNSCRKLLSKLTIANNKVRKAMGKSRNVNEVVDHNYSDVFRIKLFLDDSKYKSRKHDHDYECGAHPMSDNSYWRKTELIEGVDFKINWNTMEVVLFKPINNATYLFALYVNNQRLNEVANEAEKYHDTKLIPITADKFLFISPSKIKYELVIDSDGTLRTELFILDSKVPIEEYQVKSINGNIYDIRVDDDGVLNPTLATRDKGVKNIETRDYTVVVNDEGRLSTIPK